jgi:hypothetical protein
LGSGKVDLLLHDIDVNFERGIIDILGKNSFDIVCAVNAANPRDLNSVNFNLLTVLSSHCSFIIYKNPILNIDFKYRLNPSMHKIDVSLTINVFLL